jgi:hypothetical protein
MDKLILFHLLLLFVATHANIYKRDCRARWAYGSVDGLECPSSAVGDQMYHVYSSPSTHKTLDVFIKLGARPKKPYTAYDNLRKTSYNYPEQDFFVVVDPHEIPSYLSGDWNLALRKIRNLENVHLIGTIPPNATRFLQDYIIGYMKGWKLAGIYFQQPDYQYYSLYKDMIRMSGGIAIMDFIRATHGSRTSQPGHTPHFWYELVDYSVEMYGGNARLDTQKQIDYKYDSKFIADLYTKEYETAFRLAYLKKFDAIMFQESNLFDIDTIGYYNRHTRNGRKCLHEHKAIRPCLRPTDILAELAMLEGDEYAQSFPVPTVFSHHSTGYTAVIPRTTNFFDNPTTKRKRRRAFLRNILDNYNYPNLLVTDTFVKIPTGLVDEAVWRVRVTEEEKLSLDTIDMKFETRPIIVPLYPNEVVGIKTDKGVISVTMVKDGANLNLKDLFNTDWAGTTLHLDNTEEYRFQNNGSSYRMRVDAGLFLVNNSNSYFPPESCYGTPYTQAVTMAPGSKSQFFTTYHINGPWVLSDWQQKMFCCLKADYSYSNGQAAIVDLRLKRHLLQNITAALKIICEERSVFEIAYDRKGPPCERCMRASEIKKRYSEQEYHSKHNHIVVQFDKPVRARGSYQYVLNQSYENRTFYINQSFVRHENELWIPIRGFRCGTNVTIDMASVFVKSTFWDDTSFVASVTNLYYWMPSCIPSLGSHNHTGGHHHNHDDELQQDIIIGIIFVIAIVICIALLPRQANPPPPAIAGHTMLYYRVRRKKREDVWREI